jgi:DNA-binding FrmR family transcriptional regulator
LRQDADRTPENPGAGARTVHPVRKASDMATSSHSHDEAGPHLAHGVDGEIKERNLKRLRRIEGQVRGLQKMVEEDRYCADILIQISSVHEALRGVGRELMRNHLKHCASSAIRHGGNDAESMYDELIDMMYKHVR